jgi:hypothetical protein
LMPASQDARAITACVHVDQPPGEFQAKRYCSGGRVGEA